MMMVRPAAGDERVATVGEVQPFDQPEVGQDVDRPEDRRATHAEASAPRIREEVPGGEVPGSSRDQVRDDAPLLGQAVARIDQGVGELRCVDHADATVPVIETESQ